MIDNLFDIKFDKNMRVSITPNEIYNQFLLYMFLSLKKNIVIVTPNLSDANKLYVNLSKYLDKKVYIFPEDDYLTKKAIATSPDLIYMRMKFLNTINSDENKILICHTNSFLKKLPQKNNFILKKINIEKNNKIDRDSLIEKLIKIGYKRESLVTNTGEFSVRGFVIDIFPIFEDHPIRIELFDDQIEEIKIFDENTQLSTKSIESIIVKPVVDEFDNSLSNIIDYVDNPIIIYQDYNQIMNVEKYIFEQMKYYDDSSSIHHLKDIKNEYNIYLDTIDNNGKYKYEINSSSIEEYNGDKRKFLIDFNKNYSFLCTTDKRLIKDLNIGNKQVINKDINKKIIFIQSI